MWERGKGCTGAIMRERHLAIVRTDSPVKSWRTRKARRLGIVCNGVRITWQTITDATHTVLIQTTFFTLCFVI